MLLFGASTIQGLDASQLRCPATNFGIGAETAEGLMQRLPRYRSVDRADTIILQTGLNNLLRGDTDTLRDTLQRIITEMSRHAHLLLVPYQKMVRPKWDESQQRELDQWNDTQREICDAAPRCSNVPIDTINRVPERYLESDGIHLNKAGYDVLLEAINRELHGRQCASLQVSQDPGS